jgi:hypothetical protein
MPRPECPAENTAVVEETTFFSKDGINWTPHTIGWSIAGGCAILVCLSSPINLPAHPHPRSDIAHLPRERHQALQVRCTRGYCCCSVPPDTIMSNIGTTQNLPNNARCTTTSCTSSNSSDHLVRLRILYMPPVYAIVSFFSYRFFREYTYFELVQVGEYPISYSSTPFSTLTCCSLRGSWPFLAGIISFLIPTRRL